MLLEELEFEKSLESFNTLEELEFLKAHLLEEIQKLKEQLKRLEAESGTLLHISEKIYCVS